ncbi:glycosyltransferase [Primorskyibacter flagellatus]|uniref:glycosyltransferase n=1 Tax=Primorskyibacter flagellatus TaxID=1387277 RepID=UPI003A946411
MDDDAQTLSVTVLMATHEGAATLCEQIDSILGQTLSPRCLIVSDDGSQDGTREILQRYAERRDLTVMDGPCAGASANFLHLLAMPSQTDLVALSDQDDVWLPQKLERAAAALRAIPAAIPALFCARPLICSADLTTCRIAPLPSRAPGFRHAMVQNIAGGNCMVMNRAATDLIQAALAEVGEIPYHDWWIYQLITGAGGTVLTDDVPSLKYRQHRHNEVGSGHRTLRGFLTRPFRVLSGRYAKVSAAHANALLRSSHRLTAENHTLLESFVAAQAERPLTRLQRLRALGVYRQGRSGTLALWCAALMGRI